MADPTVGTTPDASLSRILDNPADAAAWDAALSVAESPSALEALVKQVEEAAGARNGQDAALLWMQAAQVWEAKLGRPDRAEAALLRSMAADAQALDAMRALAALLEKAGRFMDMAALLERIAAATRDDEKKAEVLERLGKVQDQKLSSPEKALVSLLSAFRVDRTRLSALRYARSIHARMGREELAKQLLDTEADALSKAGADDEAVSRLADEYAELAQSMVTRPSLHKVAQDAAARALALSPGHARAEAATTALREFGDKWQEHVRQLRDEALDARDKRVAASRYLSVAQIYKEYGKDRDRALEFLDKCLLLTPGHRPALKFLEQMHREAGTTEALMERLKQLASDAKDPEVACEIHLMRTVLLAEMQAPRPVMAEAYGAVLQLDPANKSALNALLEILLEQKEYPQAVERLQAYAQATQAQAERKWALFTVARILDVEQGDAAGAIRCFESIVELDARDVEALEHLESLYARANRPADYARVLESLRQLTTDEKERLRCLDLLARTYANDLKLADLAFESQRQAFLLDPKPARETELSRLAEPLGRSAELGDTFQRAAGRMPMGAEKNTLLIKAARLFHAAQDGKRARAALDPVLAADPTNRAALDILEQLSAKGADARELVQALKQRLSATAAPADRRGLLVRIARLYADELKETAEAVAAWREVLSMDGEDKEALAALDDLLRRDERWTELASVLRARLQSQPDHPEAPQWRLRLARACEERLDRPDEAAELYLGIHAKEPDRVEVTAALERLLTRGVQTQRIASVLEPHYAKVGAWRRYAEMLEIRRQGSDTPKDRLQLARQAARIFEEELRSPREAFKALSAGLMDMPSDAELPRELERLAGPTKLHAELCDTIQMAAGLLPESPARVGLLSRRAALLSEALGRDGDAIAAHKQLVADHPRLLVSWDALIKLHVKRGEFALAADALEAAAGVAGDEERAPYLQQLGELCMEELRDFTRATTAFEPLRSHLDEKIRDTALDALDAAYSQLGDHKALSSVLADRATVATGAARSEFRARLGELLAGPLGQPTRALEALELALAADLSNSRARTVLEAMIDVSDEAPVQLGAARLLEPVYRAASDAKGLTRVIKARMDAAPTPAEKREHVVSLATAYARDLRQPEVAVELLCEHLKKDPQDDAARKELEAVARFAGHPERIAETYDTIVTTHGGAVALDYGKRLGALYDRAGDREGALKAYAAVLQAAPRDVDALQALVRLRRLSHDARPLAEALEALSETQEQGARAASLREAASLWTRVNDTARALDALRRAEESGKDDVPTLRAMVELHELREETGPLADVLGRLATQLADPERSVLLVRLGRLRLEKLGEPAAAIQAVSPVLEASGASDVAIAEAVALLEAIARSQAADGSTASQVLVDHYKRNRAPAPLAALLEHRSNTAQTATERARILDEVSRIYENDLAQKESAFMAACRALRDEPNDERRERAETLAALTRSFDAFAGVLEDVAEATAARDPVAAAERWREIARVAVEKLSDRALAIRCHREILKLVPGDAASLAALEQFHRAGAETDALVDVLKAKAAAATDATERRDTLLQAARLLQDERGDLQGAESVYRTLLSEAPEDRELLELLDALYVRSGQPQQLASVLPMRIQQEEQPRQRALLGARLGKLLMEQGAGSALAAFQVLQRAADDDIQSLEVAAALQQLLELARQSNVAPVKDVARVLEKSLRARNDHTNLPNVLEARLVGENDPAQRAAVLMELARVHEEMGRQPTLAFMAACRAVRDAPGDENVRERAERLAQATDSMEELGAVYEDVLAQTRDGRLQAVLSRRVASISESRLKDVDGAIHHLRNALLAAPDDVPTLEQMARLLRQRGASPDLLDVLRRLARQYAGGETPERAKDIYVELAQVAETLGDLGGAIAALNDVLVLDGTDRQVMRSLERLFMRTERAQDLAGIITMQIGLAQSSGEASDLRIKLAEVRRGMLADPIGASAALQQAAQDSPGNAKLLPALEAVYGDLAVRSGPDAATARTAVAALLEPRYEALGDAQKLVGVLDARLEGVIDLAERKVLWRRIAGLREGPLRNPDLAFAALGRALKEAPDDDSLRKDVERLAQLTGDIDTLVGLYLDVLEEERSGELSVIYRRRVATLYETGLGDLSRAVEHYRLALEHLGNADGDEPAKRELRVELLGALERLHRALNEPAALADVLRRRAAVEKDPKTVRAVLMEVSKLQSEMQDTGSAIGTLRRLLELNPTDLEALRNLQAACERQERWQELVDALLKEAELCATQLPDRELDARYRAATILDAELDRSDDALAQLNDVLTRRPDHAVARAYLEDRLRSRPTQRDATAALLRKAYEASGDWKRTIDVMEALISDAEIAGDRDRARNLLVEVADLYQTRLELTGPAFGALCRALKVDRSNESLRERLLVVARAQGTVEELAEVYEDEASGADLEGRTPVAAELREAAAHLHEKELGAPERAIELYEQVLQKMPGRLAPLEALQRLYAGAQRWQDLEVTVRKRLAVADGATERAPLLQVLGATLGRHLNATEEAVEALEEAFRLDSARADTRQELIDLYERMEAHEKMVDLLNQELAHQLEKDPQEALRVRARIGRLFTEALNRPKEALEHYQALRAAFPGDRTIFEETELLLRRLEMWADLKALYDEELTREKDSARVQELSAKVGAVLTEHLGEADAAIQKYSRILELNPRDLNAMDALRRIYKKEQRWDDLVAILRRLRRLQTESAGIKAVQFDLAEVLQAQGKRADSIEAGRRVLDIEPHSDEDLARLYAVFEANEAFEDCAGVLERRVAIAGSDLRSTLLFELAELWEGPLGRKERAASAYERILAQQPGHLGAYERLAAVYEHVEDWRKLVGLKETRLNLVERPEEKVPLLREIGALYETRLGEKSLAFLAACRAFQEDPMDRDLGQWAERLGLETESAEELVVILEDTVSKVDDTARAIEIYLKMAEICAEHIDQPQEAENHLNLVFDLDAQNPGALQALERLYTTQERWADVVRVMERKLLTDDEEARRAVLFRMASVQEERLHNPADAITTFKRILEIDGRDGRAVQNLMRLYEETGRWQALIGLLTRALELSEDLGERVALRYRIATIQETELQDLDDAVTTYRQVLDEDPGHSLSLKALERIYTQQERYPELLGVFERQFTVAGDDEERVHLLAKMASLHEEHFQNPTAAIDLTRRILDVDSNNLPAIRNLERLYRETSDPANLIAALQLHVDQTADAEERLNLQLQMAELYYKELNKADKAEEIYQQALRYDPQSIKAIQALGHLYERSGNWFNALEKLHQEAELLNGSPQAVETYYRMGSINADMLMDVGAARTCYENALRLDPDHVPSLQALKSIHFQAKEWDLYLKRLSQEADATKDVDLKTELLTSCGQFLQERNADIDGAVRYYERALQHINDYVGAARPLSDIEFRRENYPRAEELLDIVVRKLDPAKDTKELCRQYYRLGYITEKQGKDQKALKNYQKAYEIDPTYLPALEGLGAALVRTERWEEAQKIYQTILIHHRESLTDAEVVDYYFKLAEIAHRIDQPDRALRNLEKALEIDVNHAPSLLLRATVHEAGQAYEDAYDALSRVAGLLGGDEKVQLLMRIGALSQKRLNDAYRAIDAYEEANRLSKDDKEILTALLNLFRETKQGPKAVETLEELVRLEPDEATRVRLNHQLGEIYRDEIRNEMRAVQYFNAALDLDSSYLRSFEAIEKLLSEKKMWRALEENYRAMIQRTPKDQVKIRTVFWKNLAELYHLVLKDLDNAIMAYGVLCRMDPENIKLSETLAELLARRQGKEDEAIAQYQMVLPRSEEPTKALHQLARLYLNRRLPDRSLCAVNALRLLKDANQEEMNLYNLYAPQAPQRHEKRLTEKLWDSMLVHERAQTPIATISSMLWHMAPLAIVRSVQDLQLHKRKEMARVDIEQSMVFAVKQLAGVGAVFGTSPYEFWMIKGSDAPPQLLPAAPLALTVGDQHPMFREMPAKVLWALWGRTLSYMRPAFVLPRVLGPQAFRVVLEAAMFIIDTSGRYATDPRELEKVARNLIRAEGVETALRSVKGAVSRKDVPNVDLFYEGMEHTAVRAMLVACNDVDITVNAMKVPDPQSPPPPKTRVRELVLFLISEQYAELRGRLGLALKG